MNTPTVFIVDDDEAVRDSLAMLCEATGLSVQTYPDAESFLADFHPEHEGCIILDVRMSGMNGPQLHAELKRRDNHLPIIYLTAHGDIPMTVRAMKDGAVDFLTKPVVADELLERIQDALKRHCDWSVRQEKRNQRCQWLGRLTPREKAVMKLIVAGKHNKEIGRQLGISYRTVELHRSRVLDKSGVTSPLELAQLALDCGIDTPT